MDKKEEKEDLILEAALKVIKEKGFHGARMADIARKAGISYGLIYHYLSYIYLPWSPRDLCLCNGIGISAA